MGRPAGALEAKIRRDAWFSYGSYALKTLAGLRAGALMVSRRRAGVVLAVVLALAELIRDVSMWPRTLRSFLYAQKVLFGAVPLDTLRTDITAIWSAAAIVLLTWMLMRRPTADPGRV